MKGFVSIEFYRPFSKWMVDMFVVEQSMNTKNQNTRLFLCVFVFEIIILDFRFLLVSIDSEYV